MNKAPVGPAKLSIITTCKGRLAHLRRTLPAMASQPGVEVIVVDYDCPEHTADWVEQHHPSVKTVRIENRPLFNASHSHNLGAAAASGDWLCFMDADIEPAQDFCQRIAQKLEPSYFYTAAPFVPEKYGTCVLPREAYLRVGGYDEVMEPWSYEDKDLYTRLREIGLKEDHFPATLLSAIPHDDAARMRFTASASRLETMQRNAFYVHAKLLVMRALGRPLNEDARRRLYAQIKQAVAENPGRSEIILQLPDSPSREVAPGAKITSRIVVTLHRKPRPGQ